MTVVLRAQPGAGATRAARLLIGSGLVHACGGAVVMGLAASLPGAAFAYVGVFGVVAGAVGLVHALGTIAIGVAILRRVRAAQLAGAGLGVYMLLVGSAALFFPGGQSGIATAATTMQVALGIAIVSGLAEGLAPPAPRVLGWRVMSFAWVALASVFAVVLRVDALDDRFDEGPVLLRSSATLASQCVTGATGDATCNELRRRGRRGADAVISALRECHATDQRSSCAYLGRTPDQAYRAIAEGGRADYLRAIVRDAGTRRDLRGKAALSLVLAGEPVDALVVLELAADQVKGRDDGCEAVEAARQMGTGQGDGRMVRELMSQPRGSRSCAIPVIRLLLESGARSTIDALLDGDPTWAPVVATAIERPVASADARAVAQRLLRDHHSSVACSKLTADIPWGPNVQASRGFRLRQGAACESLDPDFVAALGRDLAGEPLVHTLSALVGKVVSMAVSSEGSTATLRIKAGDSRVVELWRADDRLDWGLGVGGEVTAVSFAATGDVLACSDSSAALYSADGGGLIRTFKECGEPSGGLGPRAVASGDGRRVVTLGTRGACVWDVASGSLAREVQPCGHADPPWGVATDRSGETLVAGCPGRIEVIRGARGEARVSITTPLSGSLAVASGAVADDVVVAGIWRDEMSVLGWDVASGAATLVWPRPGSTPAMVGRPTLERQAPPIAPTPDGSGVAIGTMVMGFGVNGRSELLTNAYAREVSSVAWSPDGRSVTVAATFDGGAAGSYEGVKVMRVADRRPWLRR